MKIVKENQLKIVIFTVMKNRCILHGRVFVMCLGEVHTLKLKTAWQQQLHNSINLSNCYSSHLTTTNKLHQNNFLRLAINTVYHAAFHTVFAGIRYLGVYI